MRMKKDINIEIGANIQAARERAGYTQERLSEVLGLSPNHMSAIERGVSGVSLETLRKICCLLCVSADYIIFGETQPNEAVNSIAHQLAKVKPEYQPQLNKMLSALLEMSEVFQGEETSGE